MKKKNQLNICSFMNVMKIYVFFKGKVIYFIKYFFYLLNDKSICPRYFKRITN